MRPLPLLAVALLAPSAVAQAPQMPSSPPGTPDASKIIAGSYKIEPAHTQVVFAVDHLGFSIFRGMLSQASGTLTLDPKAPAAARLSVTVPIASIYTSSKKLDEELVSDEWFDATKFPTATFASTRITPAATAQDWSSVDGNLTIHGVTRPVTMKVRFHGAGSAMMAKGNAVGFDARIGISRSEFGVGKGVPLVSDHVELTIAAAFQQ